MRATILINQPGYMPETPPESTDVTSLTEAFEILHDEVAFTADVHDLREDPSVVRTLTLLRHAADQTMPDDTEARLALGALRLLLDVTGTFDVMVGGYVHTLHVER